jgi:hypothetical protein
MNKVSSGGKLRKAGLEEWTQNKRIMFPKVERALKNKAEKIEFFFCTVSV